MRGDATAHERPRCLVEAGYGLGDVLVATSAGHAMWLLGFDVDFLVNRPGPEPLAALLRGHPALSRVVTDPREPDPAAYDVGVACHGPGEAVRRLPRPLGFAVTLGDIARHGLLGANLRVARALGFEGEAPPATLHRPDEPAAADPRTVVVHAGSDPKAPFKRWPHWEALCDALRAAGHPIAVVGTDDDRSATGWERRHDPHFGLPLVRVARLLRDARAYLGNDSGVSQLAGALGTPSLLLFGPTDARLYAPRGGAVRVLQAPAEPDEGHHPFAARFPPLDRLAFDDVLADAIRWLTTARRIRAPAVPPRRDPPRGDAAARCPTAREIAATPPTVEATDDLFQRATRAVVEGALARRDDPADRAAWCRTSSRAIGAIHLRAAAAWRGQPTEFARRRERSHLRLAWRTARSLRALARRLVLSRAPSPATGSKAVPG